MVVTISEFITDTDNELTLLEHLCENQEVLAKRAGIWADGAGGGADLAKTVVRLIDRKEAGYEPLYHLEETIQEKTEIVVREICGGNGVVSSKKAQKQIEEFTKGGQDKLPICMAKTQCSLPDDSSLLGAPEDFTITIREIILKLGAKFSVALAGDVMTTPGLPRKPATSNMDVTDDGRVLGLF